MPITNLNNTHLSEEKATALQTAIKSLETAMVDFTINLSSEERQKYGSVNEQHKLFINKVRDYLRTNPELSSPDVDWEEFERDYKSRVLIEDLLLRLEILRDKLRNTKILHDYDNYQSALDDYAYTSYKSGSQSVGFSSKYTELKSFFTRRSKVSTRSGSLKASSSDELKV